MTPETLALIENAFRAGFGEGESHAYEVRDGRADGDSFAVEPALKSYLDGVAVMSRDMPGAELQRLDAAAEALDAARDELNAAAVAYARAETIAYAKAHPRRKVTYCSAMGSTTLHVEAGGFFRHRGEYHIKSYQPDIGKPPAFLEKLNDIESEFDIRYALGGDLRLECRGDEIISELTDW